MLSYPFQAHRKSGRRQNQTSKKQRYGRGKPLNLETIPGDYKFLLKELKRIVSKYMDGEIDDWMTVDARLNHISRKDCHRRKMAGVTLVLTCGYTYTEVALMMNSSQPTVCRWVWDYKDSLELEANNFVYVSRHVQRELRDACRAAGVVIPIPE